MSDLRHLVGQNGENRAVEYLEKKGFKIIDRNWRTKYGEIDIIVSKDNFIIFVEVKTLPHGTFDTLEHILGSVKQKRIIETSKYFLDKFRQYNNSYIRFDVLVVDMPGFEPIYHIENAFSE